MTNIPQENLSGRIQKDLHQLDTLRNRPDRFRLERTLVALFLVLFIVLYSASPQVALAELTELNEKDALGSVINLDDCLENPNILIEQLTTAGFSEEDIQSVLDNVCATTLTSSDDMEWDETDPVTLWEAQQHNTASQEQRHFSFTLHGEVDSNQGLNLRMEPWTDGNRLTILQDHTPFDAVARDQTGEWLLVLVDGAGSSDLGWVFRDNTSLRDNSQVESLQQFDGQTTLPAMITTRYEGGAALRLEPQQSSRKLDRLPDSTRLMLRGRIDQPDGLWYLVEVVEPGQAGEIGFVKAHDGSESLVSQPGGNLIPDSRNNRLPELEGSNPQAAIEAQASNTPIPIVTERPTAIPTNTPRPTATSEAAATPPPTNTPRPTPTHETTTVTPIPTNTLRPSATPQEVAVAATPTPQEVAAAPEKSLDLSSPEVAAAYDASPAFLKTQAEAGEITFDPARHGFVSQQGQVWREGMYSSKDEARYTEAGWLSEVDRVSVTVERNGQSYPITFVLEQNVQQTSRRSAFGAVPFGELRWGPEFAQDLKAWVEGLNDEQFDRWINENGSDRVFFVDVVAEIPDDRGGEVVDNFSDANDGSGDTLSGLKRINRRTYEIDRIYTRIGGQPDYIITGIAGPLSDIMVAITEGYSNHFSLESNSRTTLYQDFFRIFSKDANQDWILEDGPICPAVSVASPP